MKKRLLLAALLIFVYSAGIVQGRDIEGGNDGAEYASPAFIFVGWMKHATAVKIYLPTGYTVHYDGKRLEKVQKELEKAVKAAEDSDED